MRASRQSSRFGLSNRRRRGAVLIESALVYTMTLMLILGTIVVGLGVFRYQQIASLAREGSRWASVHGPTYVSEQGQSAITKSDVMTNAILPKIVILDSTALTCTNFSMTSGNATVTLTYKWTPEAFFAPITMKSTSVTPILY